MIPKAPETYDGMGWNQHRVAPEPETCGSCGHYSMLERSKFGRCYRVVTSGYVAGTKLPHNTCDSWEKI